MWGAGVVGVVFGGLVALGDAEPNLGGGVDFGAAPADVAGPGVAFGHADRA